MFSDVCLNADDGSSIVCPTSSLLIFVDDTGHEGLQNRKFPIFGYGGCFTFARDYGSTIAEPWKAVERTFPSDMLPLHASTLKPDRLTDANFEALNGFFTNNVFGRFAAVCTDKTINLRPEFETIRYMAIAVHFRILAILRTMMNNGLFLIVENRLSVTFGEYCLLDIW